MKRFWSKVAVAGADECWEWRASRDANGYGLFCLSGGGRVRAHRFSWEMANCEIPEGLIILHRCDNPPCVNPAHLRLGTQADNVADMVAKGRQKPPPAPREELHWSATLTAAQAVAIYRRAASREPHRGIARDFGVSPTTVARIARRERWQSATEAAVAEPVVPFARSTKGRVCQGVRHPRAKLNPDRVHEIRALASAGTSTRKLAVLMGVARSTIDQVLKGGTWSHIPKETAHDH